MYSLKKFKHFLIATDQQLPLCHGRAHCVPADSGPGMTCPESKTILYSQKDDEMVIHCDCFPMGNINNLIIQFSLQKVAVFVGQINFHEKLHSLSVSLNVKAQISKLNKNINSLQHTETDSDCPLCQCQDAWRTPYPLAEAALHSQWDLETNINAPQIRLNH